MPIPPLALEMIFQVRADRTYDVVRANEFPLERWEVFRTYGGCGEIMLKQGGQFDLAEESLFLAPSHEVARYRHREAEWQFWWFSFLLPTEETLPLPARQALTLPGTSTEHYDGQRCYDLLQEPSPEAHRLASVLMAGLIAQWALRWEHSREDRHPHGEAIDRVIHLLKQNLGKPIPVAMMAKLANLSERRFRDLFEELTGKTPKRYHDELRLEAARERLTMTSDTIAAIAGQLGFSSAFHLSKAFKQAFSMPPSAIRKRKR
jgi:AraC-like DNA-binding protein